MKPSAIANGPDIAPERLDAEAYRANFGDIHPRLERKTALVEANRCYFCYDAPCVEACPTGIDIPGFIKQIATDNVEGSGLRILEANIFGGACARVCPTEILCERARSAGSSAMPRTPSWLRARTPSRARRAPEKGSPSSAAVPPASPAPTAWR